MSGSPGTRRGVQILSLLLIVLVCVMMLYHLATGWRPYWYDETVLALIICNILLQAVYFFSARDV